MKSLFTIISCLLLTSTITKAQDISTIKDLQPFFYDLPLEADKQTLIKTAREKFPGNKIFKGSLSANTRIYLEDSTIQYDYFTNKPLITTIKIYDAWAPDSKKPDTTLCIMISAHYGTDNKGEHRMYAVYNDVSTIFDERFADQKPFKIAADQLLSKGFSYFLPYSKKPSLSVNLSTGGCFPSYCVNVVFMRPSKKS